MRTRSTLPLAVVLAAAITGPRDARAQSAQPMDFYAVGMGPMPAADMVPTQLTFVPPRVAVSYQVVRLADGHVLAQGMAPALEALAIDAPADVPFRVSTSDVALVHFGHHCGGCTIGALSYPTDDGATTVGRRFIVWRPRDPSSSARLYIAAREPGAATHVTYRALSGALVQGRADAGADDAGLPPAQGAIDVPADSVWTDVGARADLTGATFAHETVYEVIADHDVSIGIDATNGYKTVPPRDRVAACVGDDGADFLARMSAWGGGLGAVVLFNEGAAPLSVNLVLFEDGADAGVPGDYAIAPGALQYVWGLRSGTVRATTSTSTLAMWVGSVQDGSRITALGDDVTLSARQANAPAVLANQTLAPYVFAAENNTVVTVLDGAGNTRAMQTLARDQSLTVDDALNEGGLRVVASRPITVETRGLAGPPDDWGAWLRPAPRTDSDGDGTPDLVEGPGCLSVAADRNRNGRPDFLEPTFAGMPDAGTNLDGSTDGAVDASAPYDTAADAPGDREMHAGTVVGGCSCTVTTVPRAHGVVFAWGLALALIRRRRTRTAK